MQITEQRIYTGRNIYSHKTCIRLTIDMGELVDVPTKELHRFNDKLVVALPGLARHKCSLDYEGGFKDRLEEGTYLPHVFEHMLIEMQNNLGFIGIRHGRARQYKGSLYHVIVQYEDLGAVIACVETGFKCINAFIRGQEFPMQQEMEAINRKLAASRLGPSTVAIFEEAVRRGVPVMRIGMDSLLQLGYGKTQRRIEATLTERTSCIGVDVSCDKELTRELLQYANIPVASGAVADNVIGVMHLCRKIGFPIVIKPINGCKGLGVTVGITSETEAVDAYNEALRFNPKVLVEKHISGNDYRILVVDGRVVAVTHRIPPFVTGDGTSTVSELIKRENQNPQRGFDHEKPLTRIVADEIVTNYLRKKGQSLGYVAAPGERVTLRFNANLSTGGVAEDCTELIHPSNAELAVRAAKAIGLDIAGVDLCVDDITQPVTDQGGAVIEINSAPGIRMHMYPTYGKVRNVAVDIVDYLFRDISQQIPVISVTGTNGKTTVTRMIAHVLSYSGLKTGMTTTGGVYVGKQLVRKGDTTGPESAKMILLDKEIEAAVLETARGGIVRSGLGYDLADVGVVTNVSEDHLGIDGVETIEQLVLVKSLVAEAVKPNGCAVLNADDPNTLRISDRVTCEIVYFSCQQGNMLLQSHRQTGGRCVYLENGVIKYYDGKSDRVLTTVEHIPATMGGRLNYNVANALAAIAACIGARIATDIIVDGLCEFHMTEEQNPGRFNVHEFNGIKVVVDYGHNIEAYRSVTACLKLLGGKRLVGIIGVPGDRTNSSAIEVGRIAAQGFDKIYIKEDVDRRGRKIGEIAQLLEQGVRSSGMPKDCFTTIINEGDALAAALRNGADGDVIVIFYEDLQLVKNVLSEYKQSKNDKVMHGGIERLVEPLQGAEVV